MTSKLIFTKLCLKQIISKKITYIFCWVFYEKTYISDLSISCNNKKPSEKQEVLGQNLKVVQNRRYHASSDQLLPHI